MTTLREAAQQARDWIDDAYEDKTWRVGLQEVFDALDAALAQPEEEGPMISMSMFASQSDYKDALRAALDAALAQPDPEDDLTAAYMLGAAEARQKARLEPATEPVAWRDHVEQRIRTWRHRIMNCNGDRVSLDDYMSADDIADLVDFVCDEYVEPKESQPADCEEAGHAEGHRGNALCCKAAVPQPPQRVRDLMLALLEADTIMGHDDEATEWRERWAHLWAANPAPDAEILGIIDQANEGARCYERGYEDALNDAIRNGVEWARGYFSAAAIGDEGRA